MTTEIEQLKAEAKKYNSADELARDIGFDYTVKFPNHNKLLEAIDNYIRNQVSENKEVQELRSAYNASRKPNILGSGNNEILGHLNEIWTNLYNKCITDFYNIAKSENR